MSKRRIVIALLILLLILAGVAAFSTGGSERIIDMELSGAIMHPGAGLSLFDVNLQGSPGPANARGLGVSNPPVHYEDLPPGNRCVDIPNSPDGVLLTDAWLYMLFNDGSMVYGVAAEGGYVCFAPGFAYAPYELTGGTGRFEGASGHVTFEIDTHPVGAPGSPVTVETGSGKGEIFLP